MPSRFIVRRAARAVGMTRASPSRSISFQHVGGDRLDLRHDDVRLFLFDQRAQCRAVRHVDDMGAMRDLMSRRIGVTIHRDGFHAEALQRDDDFLAQLAAAEQHDSVAEGVSGVPRVSGFI